MSCLGRPAHQRVKSIERPSSIPKYSPSHGGSIETHQFFAAPISFVAINSNDVEKYPDDGPEHMKTLAEELSWRFPFCLDASQELAKTFQAACFEPLLDFVDMVLRVQQPF